MANAGGNSDVFTNLSPIEGRDTKSGSITEKVSNVNKTSFTKMEVGENNGHVDEIDKWVDSLKRLLEDVPSYMCSRGHPGRISRIPESLREVDVRGYEPYFMSIGPYHHGNPRVQPMEIRKKMALKGVLKYRPELTLKDYLYELLSIESTARSFYTEVEMDTEKFVRMLLLDGVYIVTALCGIEKREITSGIKYRADEDMIMRERQMDEEENTADDNENLKMIVRDDEPNDSMSNGESWHWIMFAHDLFLIENQLPFFVLQKIHNLIYGGFGTQLLDILKYEVANMLRDYTRQDSETVILQTEEVHHVLHLCHMLFRPRDQQESNACHNPESSQMFRLGSAMQLYEAGVQFEAISGSADYGLLDITFDHSGKMTMPCLYVDDNTESLLRNLIALEQMKYPSLGLHVSAYIVLLLHLITIPKDVELLRRKGIIQHHLASDKEMMYFINRLSTGLAFDYVDDKYSLKHVFHELKRYSERRGPQWRAWLKHRHFSNPWTTMSLFAASILLLLTFLQTYYAVYSYYNPYF